jgi:hypothetical protein
MRQKDHPRSGSPRAGWDAYMTPCMALEDLWI